MRKAGTEKSGAEKAFDITKQKLYALDENFYYDCERGTFIGLYEYSFRPEEYFGPLAAGDPTLCFDTEWSMDTDDVSMYYWGDFEESRGAEELEKVLTEKEKTFFKELMDQICMEKYGILISELHKPLTPEEKEDIV